MALRLLLHTLLLSLLVYKGASVKGATDPVAKAKEKRQLKRSHGQRWDSIHQVVRAEIRSATRHFLQERSRALVLPIEVDLLLVGFDGDGGYGYSIDRKVLDELLGTATQDNTICPTVWETGESAAVCYSVNYITLDPSKLKKGIERMENALVHNMEWVGDRSQDWPDGSKEVQVYEVEANGEIEATVWELLDEAYEGKQPEVNRKQHSQIVIVNPSKVRMKPLLPPSSHAPTPDGRAHLEAHQQVADAVDRDFLTEWIRGNVNSSNVVEHEAGFLYRYRYNGRGGSSAFVGQYNFLLIDVSAGPVSYGPLASPAGAVAPTAMPRLMPMLLRMTRELEANMQPSTFREHLLQEASQGQSAVFAGQLASTVAAATRHLFASDMYMAAAEGLGGGGHGDGPKRVVVPIIILQDHVRELEHEEAGLRWVDVDMIQLALDEILPPEVSGAVAVSRHMLHHHKQLAAALIKARHSRSDAVLLKPPDVGLHRSETTSLDSSVLLRELRLAAADDELMAGLTDHLADDYLMQHSQPYGDDEYDPAGEHHGRRVHQTKVLPVFVFSLERSPEQTMFDNKQMVASSPDVVAVVQLLGNPASDDFARGRVYSGHMMESHHLMMDAGEAPTRSIISGLATALGGMVPAHQRFCQAERAVVEDWRWAVGAVPWGPYSNYTALSSVFAASARRNLLAARIERPLRRLTAALNRIDKFVVKNLQAPFAFLRRLPQEDDWSSDSTNSPFHQLMPHHHLLDDLARQHIRYQNHTGPKSYVRSLLSGGSSAKPNSSTPTAPAPSPGSGAAHPPQHQPAPHHHSPGSPDDDEGHFLVPDDGSHPHHDYPDGFHHQQHEDGGFDDEHEDGQYDQPIILSPEELEAANARYRNGGDQGGHGRKSSNPEDLVVDQKALTPDVVQRLQKMLVDIGDKLEHISYYMYSRQWAELDDALPAFTAAVSAFVGATDRDLSHAAEVISCCAVTHVPSGSGAWFLVGVVVTTMGTFFILAFVVIRGQRLYTGAGGRISRASSSRQRSLSGSLPSWSTPGTPSLPR